MMPFPSATAPREAALLALNHAAQNKGFAEEYLQLWQSHQAPSPQDYALALQLTSGTLRMRNALDALATTYGRLPKKRLEKWLVRLTLYQIFFLDRIPHYAIVNEGVNLAKTHGTPHFARFLNSLARQAIKKPTPLPTGDDPKSLSIRLSYPEWFVDTLIREEGIKTALQILQQGNEAPSPPTARWRGKKSPPYPLILTNPLPMVQLPAGPIDPKITQSPLFYLQNPTPVHLITQLSLSLGRPPTTVLDLCAAPGGKLLAIHDLFPKAQLWANDTSKQRLHRLYDNLNKFEISATVSHLAGERFESSKNFDLIILDVPCSNSGVLHKRPEARWRLSPQHLEQLEQTQKTLLQKAAELLQPDGRIFYMTCSILPQENERLINATAKSLNLITAGPYLNILPNGEGWDGGFGVSLKTRDF